MDPAECYLEMYDAMRRNDFVIARERAFDLKTWVQRGGFYPPNYSQTEVDGYLANVLRRTAGYDTNGHSDARCNPSGDDN